MLLLITGGTAPAAGQGVIDPNSDNDGDGSVNSMDPDDDNDGVYDDQDYYPLDPSRSVKEAEPTATPIPSAAQPPPPTPTPVPAPNRNPDFDGDGNPDVFDPDDDNDGIVDEHDSAPYNAAVGVAPTPSTIDSGADNDKDGIANSHDPDDDNDGVVDDDDCAPFDAAIQTCAQEPQQPGGGSAPGTGQPGTSTAGSGAAPGQASAGSGPSLLVTSLPSTGTGSAPGHDGYLLVVMLLAIGGALASLGTPRARRD